MGTGFRRLTVAKAFQEKWGGVLVGTRKKGMGGEYLPLTDAVGSERADVDPQKAMIQEGVSLYP